MRRNARKDANHRKYGNMPTEYDGIKFASKKEAERYLELKLMQRGGVISELECQPKFTLQDAFATSRGQRVRAITYTADFKYRVVNSSYYGDHSIDVGTVIIEDVKSKGTKTQAFVLRWKMLQYLMRERNDVSCEIWE